MNHFTILTDDVERTCAFYRDLLDLHPGWRPPFDFPGAWLYAAGGDQAILHVIGGRKVPPDPGVIDHMAFTAQGLDATVALLDARGIRYDLRPLPGRGTWQLFFHDPNGAKVELDFAPEEREGVASRPN
jgi:catechol 2,3-dioxygenase-like lactoylglutathione lyase family enzyme